MTRLSRFANYLRSILPHSDVTLTEMTAKAIGQLALAEGTYTAEYVEFEVKRALEWITGNENKKLASVSRCGWEVVDPFHLGKKGRVSLCLRREVGGGQKGAPACHAMLLHIIMSQFPR